MTKLPGHITPARRYGWLRRAGAVVLMLCCCVHSALAAEAASEDDASDGDDVFIPTEDISEDSAVPFPVDI
ncbi:MAG: hypothetical protein AAF515_19400 [Pseudomonadota bacterium]